MNSQLSTLNSQLFLLSHWPQGEGDQNEHLDGVEDAVGDDAGHFGHIEETPDLLKRLVDFYASQVIASYDPEPRRFSVVRGAEKALVAARTSMPSRPPSSRRCTPPTKVQ